MRDKSLAQVRDEILRQLRLQEPDEKRARDYMSSPAIGLEEGHSIAEADELMLHFGLKGVPIFAKGTRRCLGVLDVQVTQKALAHGLGILRGTDGECGNEAFENHHHHEHHHHDHE